MWTTLNITVDSNASWLLRWIYYKNNSWIGLLSLTGSDRIIVLQETGTPTAMFWSHRNSFFSSLHPLDFNMLVFFSSATICRHKNGTPKVIIGEVWNSVCCHGNKTGKLVLWSTFSRILLQTIKNFWYKLGEISCFIIFDRNQLSVWLHHVANLHIFKTLEQRDKQYHKSYFSLAIVA